MKYAKKPVIFEAFQLDERGLVRADWFWDAVIRNDIITHNFGKWSDHGPAWCEIKTLDGVMVAKAGDYIVKSIKGEIYSCKADIFEMSFKLPPYVGAHEGKRNDGTYGYICNACGYPIGDHDGYCSECGARVAWTRFYYGLDRKDRPVP